MRKHLTVRNLVGVLALLGALLLRGDIAADDATCCNLSGSYNAGLFPGGDGDEGFFGLPVGAPGNAMIILDNSGSMMEFPSAVPNLGKLLTRGTGRCSGFGKWDDHSAKRSRTPYDNGTTNPFIVDNPPWGLNRCGTSGSCLFHPDSYYKYMEWDQRSATQYSAGSSDPGQICYGAVNPSTCQTCLDDVGYYFYRDDWGDRGYLFKGDYLNGYPPKFVIARKVVKDLVAIDQNNPRNSDSIRFGLTIFNTNDNDRPGDGLSTTDDGGVLVVPLGPNCDLSLSGYLSTSSTQVAAYQQARQKIVDAVNDTRLVSFGSWTPLGETLFNVGQYFSDTRGCPAANEACHTSGQEGPRYDYMFGTSWTRSSFHETAAGTADAPWVGTGRQESICWSCQQSSAIIVTDGAPTNDNNVPSSTTTSSHTAPPTPATRYDEPSAATTANDFRMWNAPNLNVPSCHETCTRWGGCTSDCSDYILQKVASFLHTQDLRPDLSNTQNVTTYTISFGIDTATAAGMNAHALLDWAAQLGGGKFYNTSSGEELAAALQASVADTVARANSFSVSNTNTLQTGNNNQLVLARFRKLLGTMWEGHLFRYRIFNEWVEGCDSTKSTSEQTVAKCTMPDGTTTKDLNPNLNKDEDCNGHAICDGVFVVDQDCNPVAEDENGDFRKATLDAETHQYKATAKGATPNKGANPYWDAGASLSYKKFPADYPVEGLQNQTNAAFRSADASADNKRLIYTKLIGDGSASATNTRIEFTPANAAQIAPYLELNGSRKIGATTVNYCVYLLERIGLCGDSPLPACPVPDATTHRVSTADETTCAVQVINWIRGWDVLDEDNDGCAGPGNPSNAKSCPGGTWDSATSKYSGGGDGEERIRGTFEGIDATGAPGPHNNDARQVQEFWKLGDIFHSSPVVVKPPVSEFLCDLGLEPQCVSTIHSPAIPNTKPTPADYDANDNGKVDPGENAYTIWRKSMAQRTQIVLVGANDGMLHAFDAGSPKPGQSADWLGIYPYTPGTGAELWAFIPPDMLPKLKLAMDDHQYFVDGDIMVREIWVDNDSRDGKREPSEFHTVAVLAERSGGTHYTALDITDTKNPQFLWTFPPNCSSEQNLTGQTWTSFTPRPPPIGPVKLATSDATIDPTGRKFEERWIVMLSGGFDPTLTRGRGVWMLDVWTGKTLWKYTDAELKSAAGNDANLWPVAATVGMTDIGIADGTQMVVLDGDGYFDTANWGDLGGTLFVARMFEPGVVGSDGLVTNWYGARAFEEQRQTDGRQLFAGRTAFFHMSANAVHLRSGVQHTYLGGGYRDQLLQGGAACGPNNILGCFQAGCSGSVRTNATYDGCGVTNLVTASDGAITFGSNTNTCATPHACGSLSSGVVLTLNCGGSTGTNTATMTCDSTGSCSARNTVAAANLFPTKLTTPTQRNRFYGIWSYGKARSFSTSSGATTFDGHRLTDVDYATTCTGTNGNACRLVDTTYARVSSSGTVTCPASTTCSAGPTDPGWMYEYGRTCPLGTGKCTDPLPWSDEKTASGATLIDTCVDWNTFRPRGAVASVAANPCESSDTTKARNYTYLADFIKGVPQPGCGYSIEGALCGSVSEVARASQRLTIAPPPDPTQMVGIDVNGHVRLMGAQIEPGGNPSTVGIGKERELTQPLYWLEVDPSLHTCRHVTPSSCQ